MTSFIITAIIVLLGIYAFWGEPAKYRYRRMRRFIMYLVVADACGVSKMELLPFGNLAFQMVMGEIGVTNDIIKTIKDEFRYLSVKRDAKHYLCFENICYIYRELKRLDDICISHLEGLSNEHCSATRYIRNSLLHEYKEALYENRRLQAEDILRHDLHGFFQSILNELYSNESDYAPIEAQYSLKDLQDFCMRFEGKA